MEKCEFSETQFVLGYTRELLNSLRTPFSFFAPSTSDEAEWASDVIVDLYGSRGHYRFSEFYQFKRSKLYNKEVFSSLRRTTKDVDTRTRPKYGFNIYNSRETRQFNVLQQLAKTKRYHVYYCAPLFHKISEFRSYFSSQTILNNSKLIDLSQEKLQKAFIKLDSNHKILFDRTEGHICSDPEEIESIIASERPDTIVSAESSDYIGLSREIKELDNFITSTLSQYDIPFNKNRKINLFSIREELNAYFNIDWFPVFDKSLSYPFPFL